MSAPDEKAPEKGEKKQPPPKSTTKSAEKKPGSSKTEAQSRSSDEDYVPRPCKSKSGKSWTAEEVAEIEKDRHKGQCKWFNVLKGYGFIIPDDLDEDVFVHQTELQMEGFRSLQNGERVSFYLRVRETEDGWEAYAVGAEDPQKDLVGSEIRPMGRKRNAMIRCFKCGKFARHVAATCKRVPVQGKVCYKCNSQDHLYAQCPLRSQEHNQEEAKKVESGSD